MSYIPCSHDCRIVTLFSLKQAVKVGCSSVFLTFAPSVSSSSVLSFCLAVLGLSLHVLADWRLKQPTPADRWLSMSMTVSVPSISPHVCLPPLWRVSFFIIKLFLKDSSNLLMSILILNYSVNSLTAVSWTVETQNHVHLSFSSIPFRGYMQECKSTNFVCPVQLVLKVQYELFSTLIWKWTTISWRSATRKKKLPDCVFSFPLLS